MREANFSESQLQQAVNTAYIRHVYETHGVWVFANVPSLIDEFDLGWDSAFHFPWFPCPPLPDHEGCNFFIQYKLSGELASAGAKEWKHWKTKYFRFKIPYSTKDSFGKFVDDYHQWDRLKELSNEGYPTFYATNSTLNKDDLRCASREGTLLNDVPLLDVREVDSLHKYVTFTSTSTFFLMHSDKEESNRLRFSTAIEKLSGNETAYIEEATKSHLRSLMDIGSNDEGWTTDLKKIRQLRDNQAHRAFRDWITQGLLCSFLRKHLGAELLWLPKTR